MFSDLDVASKHKTVYPVTQRAAPPTPSHPKERPLKDSLCKQKAVRCNNKRDSSKKGTSALAQLEVHFKQHLRHGGRIRGSTLPGSAGTVPAHQAYLHLDQLAVKLLHGGNDP